MRLENWYITDNAAPWMAPELIRKFAHGNVYGHPNFNDGEHVHTSWLKEINIANNYVLSASGSRYELGTPDPEYAAQFLKG